MQVILSPSWEGSGLSCITGFRDSLRVNSVPKGKEAHSEPTRAQCKTSLCNHTPKSCLQLEFCGLSTKGGLWDQQQGQGWKFTLAGEVNSEGPANASSGSSRKSLAGEFRMTSYSPPRGPFHLRGHTTDKTIAIGLTCLSFSVASEIILKLNSFLCVKMGKSGGGGGNWTLQKLKYHVLPCGSKFGERGQWVSLACEVPLCIYQNKRKGLTRWYDEIQAWKYSLLIPWASLYNQQTITIWSPNDVSHFLVLDRAILNSALTVVLQDFASYFWWVEIRDI